MRYPGHFAPASLKREPAGQWRCGRSELSGAFRPGLIEAAQGPRAVRLSGALSGAFRPGLIEARRAPARSRGRGAVIRGISPRPH